MMIKLKLTIAVILIAAFFFLFKADSWFNLNDLPAPGMGNTASFKMEGTVPAKTPDNFGGFYKGFPSDPDKISTQDNW